MLSRQLLIILSASLGCIVLSSAGIGVWSLNSWQAAENLKTYVAQLEATGFVVETQLLANVRVDSKIYWSQFNDFQNLATEQKVTTIYLDSSKDVLFCLCFADFANGAATAHIYYYNPPIFHQVLPKDLVF